MGVAHRGRDGKAGGGEEGGGEEFGACGVEALDLVGVGVEFEADGRGIGEVGGVQGTWGSCLPKQKQKGWAAGLAWRK